MSKLALARIGLIASVACAGFVSPSGAQDIKRLYANPNPPPGAPAIASAVTVPAGYSTYYISGAGPSVADPKAPAGTVQRFGNTEAQTASVLANLKTTMAKMGLTFSDVVEAHVFLVGDPAMGGKMDFAGMNRAWSKVFGTKEQPNKPARAAFQIAGLAFPGGLVEIEFIAAKKP